jgi:hypothetical protein
MAGLIDNIALLNFGGSGNYNSNSNNRFETTNVSVGGDDSWGSERGHRGGSRGGGHGHGKGGKGGKGHCDD